MRELISLPQQRRKTNVSLAVAYLWSLRETWIGQRLTEKLVFTASQAFLKPFLSRVIQNGIPVVE